MPDAQACLMLIVVQLGLMCLAWGCLAVYVHEARPVIFSLIGYSFAAAIGLAVLSVPGSMQRPMQQAFANVSIIIALLLLCRGASGMWSIKLPRIAFVVVPYACIALIIGFEGLFGQVFIGESVEVLVIAWILVVGPLSIFKDVRNEFGAAAAWVLLLSGIGVAGGQLGLLVRACLSGRFSSSR